MNLTDSIVNPMFNGGSHAPAGSAEERAWNRAYERFANECSKSLMALLSNQFASLNQADHFDVLQETLIQFRKTSKQPNFEVNKGIGGLVTAICRHKALDLLRRKSRRQKDVSFDEVNDQGLPLSETLGACDALLGAMEEAEVVQERALTSTAIVKALDQSGKRSPRMMRVFEALAAGKTPAEVMKELGESRGYIDNAKYEMTRQLNTIVNLLGQGLSLADAVQATNAKAKVNSEIKASTAPKS